MPSVLCRKAVIRCHRKKCALELEKGSHEVRPLPQKMRLTLTTSPQKMKLTLTTRHLSNPSFFNTIFSNIKYLNIEIISKRMPEFYFINITIPRPIFFSRYLLFDYICKIKN